MGIGFIGLGQMGSRMAGRLLEAGQDLTVYDVLKQAARDLLDKGAKWADSPKATAETSSLVITMLPGPREVEEVVYGPDGLMGGWKKGDIYIDMTTSLPMTTRRVAKDAAPKGVAVLDASVTVGKGPTGVAGAQAGTLVLLVGGDAETIERARGILEVLGKKILHMGDVGCGNIAKIVNNTISIVCTNINAEAFVLGVKAGVDAEKLFEAVSSGTGNNKTLEFWPDSVLKGNFEPGFALELALKDLGLATLMGKEYGMPLHIAAAVEQRMMEAKAAGLGKKSFFATILRLEELAGVKVRTSK